MKENIESLSNAAQETTPEAEIGGVSQVDQGKIESLMKSGRFESTEEAEKFMENLNESLGAVKGFESMTEEFSSKFDNVVSEASAQLRDIEGLSEGQIQDAQGELKGIILGIAQNYGDLKGAVDNIQTEKKFSLMDIPKKLGWFVKKNKAAFVAFTALSAFARMGGSQEAEAGEIDWANNDFSADLENAVMEIQPDEVEGEEQSEVVKAISNIEQQVMQLQESASADGSYHYDSETGEEKISFDADKLISEINSKGGVDIDFKEFVVSEKQTFEDGVNSTGSDRFEVGRVLSVSQEQDLEEEDFHDKKFDSEDDNKESAIMDALSIAANYEKSLVHSSEEFSKKSTEIAGVEGDGVFGHDVLHQDVDSSWSVEYIQKEEDGKGFLAQRLVKTDAHTGEKSVIGEFDNVYSAAEEISKMSDVPDAVRDRFEGDASAVQIEKNFQAAGFTEPITQAQGKTHLEEREFEGYGMKAKTKVEVDEVGNTVGLKEISEMEGNDFSLDKSGDEEKEFEDPGEELTEYEKKILKQERQFQEQMDGMGKLETPNINIESADDNLSQDGKEELTEYEKRVLEQERSFQRSMDKMGRLEIPGKETVGNYSKFEEVMMGATDVKVRVTGIEVEEIKTVDADGNEAVKYKAYVSVKTKL